jgi:hypothetical protein
LYFGGTWHQLVTEAQGSVLFVLWWHVATQGEEAKGPIILCPLVSSGNPRGGGPRAHHLLSIGGTWHQLVTEAQGSALFVLWWHVAPIGYGSTRVCPFCPLVARGTNWLRKYKGLSFLSFGGTWQPKGRKRRGPSFIVLWWHVAPIDYGSTRVCPFCPLMSRNADL